MKSLRKPMGIIGFLFIPFFSFSFTIFDFFKNLKYFYSVWFLHWKSGKSWGIFDK